LKLRVPRPRFVVAVAVVGAMVLAGTVVAWHLRRAAVPSAEEAILTRQIQAIEAALADSEDRPLVRFDQMLLVVDQGLVQDTLRAVLPLEGDVGGFHLRLESANAAFGDGLALIRLAGHAGAGDRAMSASLVVYGGLDVVDFSPESRRLRGRISIYGVEVKDASMFGFRERSLTRALTRGGLDSLLHFVEVPVRFEDEVTIPSVATPRLHIPEAHLRLNARVALVRVFGSKLWISLEAQAGDEAPARSLGAHKP
jgi:hypothetical protein